MHACKCRCLWRPEESVRSPAVFIGGCEPPSAGAENFTLDFCKSSMHFLTAEMTLQPHFRCLGYTSEQNGKNSCLIKFIGVS